MHSFSLDLLGFLRPMIKLYGSPAIIDTGATIPMTWLSPELLQRAWNAKLIMNSAEIGGIGGKAHGKIYELYDFEIGDIQYDKIQFFVSDEKIYKYSFLLSATLFNGMDYDIDDTKNQKFRVIIPDGISYKNKEFELKSINKELYAQVDGVLLQDKMNEELVHIDNFTQENLRVHRRHKGR